MIAAQSSGCSACGVAATQQAGARSSLKALAASAALVLALCPPASGGYQVFLPPAQSPVDIIHSTDLYYPAWDWDDVNDATSLYALHAGGYAHMALFSVEEDSGDRGNGEAWRGIYAHATGLDLDWGTGYIPIVQKLQQAGDNSVVLTAVGGLGDIARAYNANPSLFAQKVKAVYTSGGGGHGRYIGADANWGTNVWATRTVLTDIVDAGVPLYVGLTGGDAARRDQTIWLMDLPEASAATDRRNPHLSTIMFWAYYGAAEGGFRFKHERLDTEKYANFDLDPMIPSPWAGNHAASRPQHPASISRAAVIADPAVFFDENQDYIYERLDGSPGWAFRPDSAPQAGATWWLTISDEIRQPPVGNDGTTIPFGIKGMWSTVCFLDATGLRMFRQGEQIQLSYDDTIPGWERVAFFDPAQFSLNGSDVFTYVDSTEQDANIHIFHWDASIGQQDYMDIIDAVNRALIASSLPPPLPGDANLDGCVDGLDYTAWSNHYRIGTSWGEGDFTGNQVVDGLDYVVWSNQYLQACPGAPVPEPAGLVLLSLVGLALLKRRPGVETGGECDDPGQRRSPAGADWPAYCMTPSGFMQ